MEALFGGYGKSSSGVDYDTPDYYSMRFLSNNLYAFSAAKTMTQIKEFSALLVDSNGKRRSFEDFKTAVEAVNKDFNVNWLRTEYDTAFANAQMARSWNDIAANDTTTSITIRTAGDERVRDTHARYEGFTALKSDPIWRSFWPPFDWACRCIAEEGNADPSGAVDIKEIPKLFLNNSGISGVAFDTSHPYFDRFKKNASAIAFPVATQIDNLTFKFYLLDELKPNNRNFEELKGFDDWWRLYRSGKRFKTEDAAIVRSEDGEKMKLTRKVAEASTYFGHINEILFNFDEHWLISGGRRTYLLNGKQGALVMKVDKIGEIKSVQLKSHKDADGDRKGILIPD